MKQLKNKSTQVRVLSLLAFTLLVNTSFGQANIEISDISVKCQEHHRVIEWVTIYEVDSDLFTLERSYDQTDWQYVEDLAGAGTFMDQTNYLVYDNTVSETGTTYYRISHTSSDGQINIINDDSAHCSVEIDDPITVFPNPILDDPVTVVKPVKDKDTFSMCEFVITNREGKTIKTGSSSSEEFTIDLSECEEGIYLLFVGNNTNPVKLIKK